MYFTAPHLKVMPSLLDGDGKRETHVLHDAHAKDLNAIETLKKKKYRPLNVASHLIPLNTVLSAVLNYVTMTLPCRI